ncbi:lincomycin-condensing protein lmbA [Zychaea mexicana]|uniref:lincomycin-condensing protein lmbA n=1 Tax=Zychaea mexicana TaxID=64656 RepID=UPI0022FF03ED|nr:lincomycin-condensing protein lmbA [Zychaea mexicana]KAI9494951.1 lincomycin-condensing protein lmbA [Zychaea mexicana]
MVLDTFPFISRRSVVYGTDGMVASSQPLATQAGIEILKKGGNAADAAVAVAAALGVTEAASTGIGGDACCLYYDAKTKKITGLNGSGRTPAALTTEHVYKDIKDGNVTLSESNIHAVTVPGAPAVWVDTIKLFGSDKLDMATILQPAIDLAENGFPVSHISAQLWKKPEKALKEYNSPENRLLIDGVHAPAEGDIMHFPDLAETYKLVAERGNDGFYKGRIADAIVEAVKTRGSLMTHEDLASYTSELVKPISIDYHGWTVWELPPNSQGITALMALGIIRALEEEHGLNLARAEHNSAEYLHVIVEALRLAFADTRHYITDPQVLSVPTERLLSKEYLSERAKLVDLKKRNGKIKKGYPDKTSDTVYFSVIDGEGNACSFMSSVFAPFGSCIVPNRCGFPLHNRGSSFVLIDGHPNCIGPKKRPYLTLMPSMVTRKTSSGDHDLEACFGIMGAYMQPQGHVQYIMNMLHLLANPQHAIDLPRICVGPPKERVVGYVPPPHARPFTDMSTAIVYVEDGLAAEAVKKLEAMGHTCHIVKGKARSMFGYGQIIRVQHDTFTGKRVLAAGSDPRCDGQAAGWSGNNLAKL